MIHHLKAIIGFQEKEEVKMEDKSIGRKRKDEEESEDAEGNVPDKEIGLGDKEV